MRKLEPHELLYPHRQGREIYILSAWERQLAKDKGMTEVEYVKWRLEHPDEP